MGGVLFANKFQSSAILLVPKRKYVVRMWGSMWGSISVISNQHQLTTAIMEKVQKTRSKGVFIVSNDSHWL